MKLYPEASYHYSCSIKVQSQLVLHWENTTCNYSEQRKQPLYLMLLICEPRRIFPDTYKLTGSQHELFFTAQFWFKCEILLIVFVSCRVFLNDRNGRWPAKVSWPLMSNQTLFILAEVCQRLFLPYSSDKCQPQDVTKNAEHAKIQCTVKYFSS